ncbi:MAG: sulfite exporter TauE/SafE family protein [Alphaproteobacteria bacterium]
MGVVEFSLLVLVGSFFAGFLGALSGLGGGVVLVPLLTVAFGVDIRYAIGASLVGVIATSCGAAAAFLKEGYTNMRIGMLLQVAACLGAIAGAWIAGILHPHIIGVIFAAVLFITVASNLRHKKESAVADAPDPLATRLELDGQYPTDEGIKAYHVQRVPLGSAVMFVAGLASGLLGVGGGVFKVLAMDTVMKIPLKVSTTTSNFMIGVTATASAGIYLQRGYIDPVVAMPVLLGVLAGSLLGARALAKAPTTLIRWVFNLLVLAVGVEMLVQNV